MLTMENVTALRMRRHCLTRRAGAAEYDALYRDLSPGLNVHWHGFGQPPCLVERADFDDVEYNGRRQRQRILVKGRFQNGNIGFVEAAQMELFAGLYRRPYKPTEHSELLRELIGREGPLNIEAMKRMTGLLVLAEVMVYPLAPAAAAFSASLASRPSSVVAPSALTTPILFRSCA